MENVKVGKYQVLCRPPDVNPLFSIASIRLKSPTISVSMLSSFNTSVSATPASAFSTAIYVLSNSMILLSNVRVIDYTLRL